MGKLILASNRLPVRIESGKRELLCRTTAGGLATGLSRPHAESGGSWVGWPGTVDPGAAEGEQVEELLAARGMAGVGLTPEEHERYYTNMSNGCIWPLFHYFTDRVHFDETDWAAYRAVNQRFAERLDELAEDDDLVFIQDFHLMLVPALLRERRPDLRIGFFLHIPFPSSEILRVFPAREQILEGLLGADVIGFHTLEYIRHFRSSLRRVLGVDSGSTEISFKGRKVRLLAQPLGIESAAWQPTRADAGEEERQQQLRAGAPDGQLVELELERLRSATAGRKLILGVERLDYTKGIPARLEAFRELLRQDPALVDEVMMMQIAVPSRVENGDYRELKDEVDRLAGAINSEFGRPGRLPLHYQFRGIPREALVAAYQLADVALVTPLRDGLNLVAKEFVASRTHNTGVLLLSEFTGAAWELGEALQVNPFDRDALVRRLRRALDMSPVEQAARMAPMRARVERDDVHLWVDRCLGAIRGSDRSEVPVTLEGPEHERCVEHFLESSRRLLFLDYDGTLREFTEHPRDATPSQELIDLLTDLAGVPGLELWIVSGREAPLLETWLGETGAGLVGEHGAFVQYPGDPTASPLQPELALDWRPIVRDVFHRFADRVPGSLVEEKPLGLAWHYRASRPDVAVWQACELVEHLGEVLTGRGLEVVRGDKVVEVRPAGLSKGQAVRTLMGPSTAADFVMCVGDDTTDETMFLAMKDQAWTIHVGERDTEARHRLPTPTSVRSMLRKLVLASRGSALNLAS